MSPSRYREMANTQLARLLEAFADERGIELEGFGSWTIKSELRERGVEPDECYVVGAVTGAPERPDFAVEVVHTSGGIDKLAVYQGLEVPEVWFFDRGAPRVPPPRARRLRARYPQHVPAGSGPCAPCTLHGSEHPNGSGPSVACGASFAALTNPATRRRASNDAPHANDDIDPF
jgi:hypothetical protein